MKKLLSLLAVGTFLFLPTAPVFAAAQEGIVAVVNDSVITATDLRDRTGLYLVGKGQPNAEQRKRLEQQVLNKLIDEALQLQQAKKMGIGVSTEETNAGFADLARQNGLSVEDFKKQIAQTGVAIDTLYSQIKADIAWGNLVRRRLRPEVNVTEGEIDMTMNQIANVSGKLQYRVAEIFLNVPSPAKERETREEAEKLVKQLTDGASFAEVAHNFSQAPGAATGGDLGWVQEGQLSEELDKALHKMNPGQVSPPIRSAKGYHIMFLRDTRQMNAVGEAEPKQKDDSPIVTLKQIGIPVGPKDPDNVVAAKIARLKNLKQEVKSCDALNTRFKDFPSPSTGDLGTGTQATLPPSMRALAEKMDVNQLSEPVRDERGIFAFMICARQVPAPAEAPKTAEVDAEASREKIAQQLGMKRLDQMAQRYLQDLRASAFIDIRL